jgi:endoglucanase
LVLYVGTFISKLYSCENTGDHTCQFYFFTGLYNTIIAQSTKSYGQLREEGTQLKDEQGNPVVLRGISFGWHNRWPRFYTAGVVQWLQEDWGCTVIRAAMGINWKPNAQ